MSLSAVFGTESASPDESGHWMSVSDLMSGLMIVFLFIAVVFMRHVAIERDKIKEVAVTYQQNQTEIWRALEAEFASDLERWNAHIDGSTLEVRFQNPDVLFETGSSRLRPAYEAILADFFPRYLGVLGRFRDSIEEVRIEGHTSSVWNAGTNSDMAYFKNMRLSQDRTTATLEYIQGLPAVTPEQEWIRRHVSAIGYSSSRLVLDENGAEDPARSRRVTFRVVTNAETQIRKILELEPAR